MVISIKSSDFHWLCGLVEGDGCFYEKKPARPCISVQMKDRDVVWRIADIFQSTVYVSPGRKVNHKEIYSTNVSGDTAVAFMKKMMPYMGARRSKKIEELLEKYSEKPAKELLLERHIAEVHSYSEGGLSLRKISKKLGCSHETVRRALMNASKEVGEDALSISVHDDVGSAVSEFHWMCGLLEAEGAFLAPPPSRKNSPRICLQMTDRDIVDRFSAMFQVRLQKYDRPGGVYKSVFMSVVRGATAVDLMKRLKPFMSERRSFQIANAIKCYDPTLGKKTIEKNAERNRKLTPKMLGLARDMLHAGKSERSTARIFDVHRKTLKAALSKTS